MQYIPSQTHLTQQLSDALIRQIWLAVLEKSL